MECKDRNNRSSILLPYSFLPSMAAGKLREAAEKVHLIRCLLKSLIFSSKVLILCLEIQLLYFLVFYLGLGYFVSIKA